MSKLSYHLRRRSHRVGGIVPRVTVRAAAVFSILLNLCRPILEERPRFRFRRSLGPMISLWVLLVPLLCFFISDIVTVEDWRRVTPYNPVVFELAGDSIFHESPFCNIQVELESPL